MEKQLDVQKAVIEIGLDQPIRLLHITDSHMDIIKSEGKAEYVALYEAAMAYAKEHDRIVVCTGDNFKGVSEDNVAYAMENIPGGDHIFLPGNHDFCGCPNNLGLSDPSYQVEYAKSWIPCYKQNLYFDSKIIGGVNFVSLQDIYYCITYGQIQMLQTEAAKGYPIVLCMHIPLFSAEMADLLMSTWARCGYMVAPPEEYYSRYNERHRKEQIPTKETLDAVAYIQNEPAIKAIIAGHIHENFDGFADCGMRQITTAPLRTGVIREIEIV